MLNVIVSPRGNELARLFTARGHDALTLGSSRLTSYVIPQQEGQFEIMLEIMDFEGMLLGNLKYQTALYDAELAQRMTDTFVATLEAIARAPDARVDELNRVERDTFEF
jgi:hypothetical protein